MGKKENSLEPKKKEYTAARIYAPPGRSTGNNFFFKGGLKFKSPLVGSFDDMFRRGGELMFV